MTGSNGGFIKIFTRIQGGSESCVGDTGGGFNVTAAEIHQQ